MKLSTATIVSFLVICLFVALPVGAEQKNKLEDKALEEIAASFAGKQDIIKMKCTITSFANLEGKETDDGKRISRKLMAVMMKKSLFIFVDRSQIAAMMKEKGLAQSGIIDPELGGETDNILQVDIFIVGVIAQEDSGGELTVKGRSTRRPARCAMSRSADSLRRSRSLTIDRNNNRKIYGKVNKSIQNPLFFMNSSHKNRKETT